MARPEPELALRVPRAEADAKIAECINSGQDLILHPNATNTMRYDEWAAKTKDWSKFTEELLRRLFTNDELKQEFRTSDFSGRVAYSEDDAARMHVEAFPKKIECLESIRRRLKLLDEPNQQTHVVIAAGSSKQVFVVHGHNQAALDAICRFLEKLGLDPIVLLEKPNEGRTTIEKLEAHSNVSFAIILLTGDDVGAAKTDTSKTPRARQNVILELGYFIGKLGRKNVCAIYEQGVELPSDYHGIGFVPLEGENWKLRLAGEMKAAGLDFDMNKAI